MTRICVVVGAALLVGSALTGCSGAALGSPDTFDVHGTFTLSDGVDVVDGSCQGSGGYDDIRDGVEATVRDADGKVLALGDISNGEGVDGTDTFTASTCTFDIDVPDVPSGQGPYSIEVSHRGEIHFEEDEAAFLSLTLG